jgi:transcriptional regulator with XRE-family HTH domain
MSHEAYGVRRCVCGTLLARDNTGGRCASCLAKSRLQTREAPEVPPDFWEYATIRDALARRHMGLVVRAFRTHPGHGQKGVSQEIAAGWAGITQAQLSRIENGAPILHLDRLLQWAQTLRIPAEYLWFSLPNGDGPQGDPDNVKRSEFLRAAGLTIAGAATASRLFAGLPVSALSDQDCAQWLAWEIWNRKVDSIAAAELPAPVAQYLITRNENSAGSMILRNADGSYCFAHRSLVDFYVAQRIFGEISSGNNKLFAVAQTTHDTDSVIREFVLRNQASTRVLGQWMKRAPSAVLRVNSAGVLAKLGSASLNDDVIRTLKRDPDTRQLYLTAVASRVLELPWSDAAAFSANVERGHDWRGEDTARVRHFADRLAAELTNPRDGAARWCGVVLLDRIRAAEPTIASAALRTALHNETNTENLRSIGAALAGDNPVSY